ncbi:MAG: hypothetical protein ACSLFQ_01530 [Thermoanaerobaculia bacterium]
MPDDNVARFPGRRERALGVIAAVSVALVDASLALPSAEYVAKVKHDARQVAALYEDDAAAAELLSRLDDCMDALGALARLGESCDAAMKPLGRLALRLASTPDDPPAS